MINLGILEMAVQCAVLQGRQSELYMSMGPGEIGLHSSSSVKNWAAGSGATMAPLQETSRM
jgi:hypothetical protein